jgi:hypothetical protein
LIAYNPNNDAFAASPPRYSGAAPYTEEAVRKIDAAFKQAGTPKLDLSAPVEERYLKILQFERSVYSSAGYSYDATIKEVAYDLQTKTSQLQQPHATVAGYIVGEVHMMMSECQSRKTDCLRLYPSDVAEAVRSILKSSKFGM